MIYFQNKKYLELALLSKLSIQMFRQQGNTAKKFSNIKRVCDDKFIQISRPSSYPDRYGLS